MTTGPRIGARLGREAEAKAALLALDDAGGLRNMVAAANGSWLDELRPSRSRSRLLSGPAWWSPPSRVRP